MISPNIIYSKERFKYIKGDKYIHAIVVHSGGINEVWVKENTI